MEEALVAAGRIGYPVALKVSSSEVAHKSDQGGVLPGLADAAALRAAVATLQQRFPVKAMLVQKMVPAEVDLNPVIASPGGAIIVDALIRVQPPQGSPANTLR